MAQTNEVTVYGKLNATCSVDAFGIDLVIKWTNGSEFKIGITPQSASADQRKRITRGAKRLPSRVVKDSAGIRSKDSGKNS